MKKILAILFFSFIWCETSNAENQQICDWIVDEVYADLLHQGSDDHLFVVVGNDGINVNKFMELFCGRIFDRTYIWFSIFCM